MRIVDIQEWALLKAAHERLKEATQAAEGVGGDDYDQEIFESLSWELDMLVVTIRSHKDFDAPTITEFKAQATLLFIRLEKVISATLDGRTRKDCKWWQCMRDQQSGLDTAESGDSPNLEAQPLDRTEAWSEALSGLTEFNESVEKLMRSRTTTEVSLPSSPELDSRHRARADEVLGSLENLSLECASSHGHQMLLEMSAQSWKKPLDTAAPLSVFLASCSSKHSWQAVECLQLSDLNTISISEVDLKLVSGLCKSVLKCQLFDETLCLLLKEGTVYVSKHDKIRGYGHSAVPEKTIQHLLDEDYLSPLGPASSPSVSAFQIRDKRVLTLDLAWTFLNLLGFKWTEGHWSSDKIFLLSSTNQSSTPVLVGKPPYITCKQLSRRSRSVQLPTPSESLTTQQTHDSPFLSLGKLLVEIHTGQSVVVTERNRLDEPSLYMTIAKIIDDGQLWSANQEYIDAVEGCLSLHKSLHGSLKYDTDSKQWITTIYDSIVSKLEQDFGHYKTRQWREKQAETPYFKSKSSAALPDQRRNREVREESQDLYVGKTKDTVSAAAPFENLLKRRRSSLSDPCQDALKPPRNSGTSLKKRVGFKESEDMCHIHSGEVISMRYDGHSTVQTSAPPESESSFTPPSCREEFEIAIICALKTEYAAVEDIVDEFWDDHGDPYGKAPEDRNNYSTGRINKHNVLLLLLPGPGKLHASRAAGDIRLSYPGVKLALLVGVCGGVPHYTEGNSKRDIFLGDVVIGHTALPFDFVKVYGDRARPKAVDVGKLGRSSEEIRALTDKYQTRRTKGNLESRTNKLLMNLHLKMAEKGYPDEYDHPGADGDTLFRPDYRHRHLDSSGCECARSSRDADPVCDEALKSLCVELQCDKRELMHRRRHNASQPVLHTGAIASGDQVMKSGTKRDAIAKELGVIAFEMESAGIWDELPCLVVKGVADYADSHKAKDWQKYAAATAACATKAILELYIRSDRPLKHSKR